MSLLDSQNKIVFSLCLSLLHLILAFVREYQSGSTHRVIADRDGAPVFSSLYWLPKEALDNVSAQTVCSILFTDEGSAKINVWGHRKSPWDLKYSDCVFLCSLGINEKNMSGYQQQSFTFQQGTY